VADRYTPPGAPLRDPPDGARRSSLAAIVLGVIVDIGGTMVFSFVFGVVAGIVLASTGTAIDDLGEALQSSPVVALLGLAGGLACTALGGYVAARFANHSEYANAFAVGAVSLVFGEVMMQYTPDAPAGWLRVLGSALVIPAAVLGGHLRAVQRDRA
jgi:hypothetical protein